MRSCTLALLVLGLPAAMAAEQGRPAAAPTAKQQVVPPSGAASSAGLDRKLFEPSQAKGAAPNQPEGLNRDTPWSDELRAAAVPEELQPLVEIARTMRRAQQGLAQSDPGPATQALQLEAIAGLDRILTQAEEQARKSAAQPGAERPESRDGALAQQKPTAQPGKTPGAGGQQSQTSKPHKPEAKAIDELLQQFWGELPQREREQLLQQWRAERFLPKYEALLDAYYRRLAQEKAGRQP